MLRKGFLKPHASLSRNWPAAIAALLCLGLAFFAYADMDSELRYILSRYHFSYALEF